MPQYPKPHDLYKRFVMLTLSYREGCPDRVRVPAPRADVPPAAGAVSRHQPGQVLRAQEQGAERGAHPHRPQDQPRRV